MNRFAVKSENDRFERGLKAWLIQPPCFTDRKADPKEVSWFVLSSTTGQWKYLQMTPSETGPIVIPLEKETSNDMLLRNVFTTGRNNTWNIGSRFRTEFSSYFASSWAGETCTAPFPTLTRKILHVSTVQGVSTCLDVRAQRWGSKAPHINGAGTSYIPFFHCFFSQYVTSLVWRRLEGTGPGIFLHM